ncbi:glutathione S-transferase family protein [Alteromonadaceae bacterium M269]|nr:glutathione S-transferase family protein [Alteromonadaceae bacterium M269]
MAILHGVPVSPYVRKVQAVLEMKGVEYTINPIIPFGDKSELLALNPIGKIPAFQDDDITLADSSVISAYLEKRYPEVSLYPEDAADYARALWFEEYADSHMVGTLGSIFFHRVLNPKFFDTPSDEEVVTKAIEEDVPVIFDYLEGQLGDNEYFVGNALSIADISIAGPFVNAEVAGLTVDATRWPKLAAFVQRIFDMPWFNNKIEL